MDRQLRKRHFGLWMVLGPALMIGAVFLLLGRPTIPAIDEGSTPGNPEVSGDQP